MTRRIFALGFLWAWVGAGIAVGGGCRRARTPEEAFARLRDAVTAGDPGAFFDSLDQRSRWAWMTVQKSHREAYDMILSNYPEGAERERDLRRFERAATLGNARELFIEEVGRAALTRLPHPMPGAIRFDMAQDGDSASAVLPAAQPLPFRRSPDGKWGYAGLASESEERQKRALGDVEMVRASAADYERVAARNSR